MATGTEPQTHSEELKSSIRASGLKVTAPRVAVLEVLQHAPHSSVEQVFAEVRKTLSGTSAQTIYGILASFTGAGLVRRFDPPDSPALFECRVGDNHHHLSCVGCGLIQDVDCVIGQAPCLTPSDDSGFTIYSAEVTFNGLCRACQTSGLPTTG
ncbi:Fur family transcriptional regulator [Arthrobacter sp. H20]|uniref:Fur family transcriptional regulator n=1 Tax=Arthrobacter sp. H20 TaxID=1267981 RepID=UPI0004B2EFA3|nr:Fur family transcriptional regulator [Arthrobacter sp. H20]